MFVKRTSRIRLLFLATLFLVLSGLMTTGAAAGPEVPVGSDRSVTVMTRNMYLGADLTPIFEAAATGDLTQVMAAVQQAFLAAVASNPATRTAAMAAEIGAAAPDLVGLQEVTTWRYTADDGSVTEVDFLALLELALDTQGLPYEPVVVATGFNLEFGPVALSVSDVILARTDRPPGHFMLSNHQSGTYVARLLVPIPGYGVVEVPRQWAAVDVFTRSRSFRFITTHLESVGPPQFPVNVRALQAVELLAGPAQSDLPVIAVGDFNAELDAVNDSAWLMVNAGFVDAWHARYPSQDGFTCCHPADLSDPYSLLEKQIDFVFLRGALAAREVTVVGEEPVDFAPIGRWPSDHAGVVATVRLLK